MELRNIFVGIDLGDKNSVARIAGDRGKAERYGFVNNARGRARLFEEVKRRAGAVNGKVWMAYEASACGFVLADEAQDRQMWCAVLAPTKMEKSVEQRKHKNDDRDAGGTLETLRGHVLAGNRLPAVWIPDKQVRDDRELIRTRLELAEKQTKLKSQVQMLLKRYGLEKPSGLGAGWTVGYRQWLQALAETTPSSPLGMGGRQALGSLLRQLQLIEEEIQRMDQCVTQLAKEAWHKPFMDELMKEPGVGQLTALVFRTEIGYAGRFRRGRQVGKFVGLTPSSYESGQQNDRKGHISHQGPPRIRKMLCQSSWVGIGSGKGADRHLYDRIVSRNPKRKKIAIVAVMRRLAVRLWHRMRQVEMKLAATA